MNGFGAAVSGREGIAASEALDSSNHAAVDVIDLGIEQGTRVAVVALNSARHVELTIGEKWEHHSVVVGVGRD